MDAAKINAKIYAGRSKAALRLGYDFDLYRPLSAANPLGNKIGTLKAAFNNGDNSYKKPNMPGDAYWFGDFDGRLTKGGDYLVGDGQTFFIAGQQSLLPIVTVECNSSVILTRPSKPVQAGGVVGYSGICDDSTETETVIGTNNGSFVGWPCSILFGKGKMGISNPLPSGMPSEMGWMILLPVSLLVPIKIGDRFTEKSGRIFITAAAELTDFGWRLMTYEVHV